MTEHTQDLQQNIYIRGACATVKFPGLAQALQSHSSKRAPPSTHKANELSTIWSPLITAFDRAWSSVEFSPSRLECHNRHKGCGALLRSTSDWTTVWHSALSITSYTLTAAFLSPLRGKGGGISLWCCLLDILQKNPKKTKQKKTLWWI